jgi:hypothetical protein
MILAHPNNPNRPPDWRWLYARWLNENKKFPKADRDDNYLGVIKRYIAGYLKCKTEEDHENLAMKFPGIFWAEQVHSAKNRDTRWAIEARLLAGEAITSIATKTRTQPETIIWYEKTFFNVLPYLQSKDYIVMNVLGKSIYGGLHQRDYDLLWKLFGYVFGPLFLDYIFTTVDNQERVTSIDQIRSTSDSYIKGTIRRKAMIAAATLPIDYNQNAVLDIYNKQLEIEKASGNGADIQATMIGNIHASLTSLRFHPGVDQPIVGPLLKDYDNRSAELRTSEMLAITLGQPQLANRDELEFKFPEDRNANQDKEGNRNSHS